MCNAETTGLDPAALRGCVKLYPVVAVQRGEFGTMYESDDAGRPDLTGSDGDEILV